ncbi:MAG: TetR/AcrR family transcriptional regulator [Acutalibacteraceae bacterium]
MKQEQRRYVSQELILAEAIKEFGKYGYGDASVNRICEAGQISKGRLFHYYKDKDELFLTCVQACYDHLQQVQEFFRAEPEEALEQTFHRYFRLRQQHFQNHPYEALMMRVAALSSPAHLKERTDQMMDHFVDATSRVLYQICQRAARAAPYVFSGGDPDLSYCELLLPLPLVRWADSRTGYDGADGDKPRLLTAWFI